MTAMTTHTGLVPGHDAGGGDMLPTPGHGGHGARPSGFPQESVPGDARAHQRRHVSAARLPRLPEGRRRLGPAGGAQGEGIRVHRQVGLRVQDGYFFRIVWLGKRFVK